MEEISKKTGDLQSWKWKMAILETRLISQGPVFSLPLGGRLYLYLSTMGYTSLSTQTRSLVMLGDFLSFVGLGNLSSEISDTLPETNSSHLHHWGCSDEFPCGKA